MLTNYEKEALALDIASLVVKMLKKTQNESNSDEEQWISTKEAAKILGISEMHMRRIKDSFPHVKKGNKQQGPLLFLKKGLVKNYLDSTLPDKKTNSGCTEVPDDSKTNLPSERSREPP